MTFEIKTGLNGSGHKVYVLQSVRIGSKGQKIYWSEWFEGTEKGLKEAQAWIRYAWGSKKKLRV